MKSRLLFYIISLFFLLSCGAEKNSEIERLQADNDSLLNYKLVLEDEVNDYFATLLEVQEGIAKIKSAQNVIPINPLSENSPHDVRNRVKSDIGFINELIVEKQEEIEALRDKMEHSSLNIRSLNKTLDLLGEQLLTEQAKVAHLERQLLRRDSIITEMGDAMEELGKDIVELSEMKKEREEIIQHQDEALNAGWYAIGNLKELRDNKIVTSEGIFSSKRILLSDFNKNYFVKVDTRETRNIPLYTSSKPKVMTTHPRSSYTVEKEEDSYSLNITNPEQFWSVSKYLVVEIN